MRIFKDCTDLHPHKFFITIVWECLKREARWPTCLWEELCLSYSKRHRLSQLWDSYLGTCWQVGQDPESLPLNSLSWWGYRSQVESTVTSLSQSNRDFKCRLLLMNSGRYWPWSPSCSARKPQFCRNDWVQQLLDEVHVAVSLPPRLLIMAKTSEDLRICVCTVCAFYLLSLHLQRNALLCLADGCFGVCHWSL